MSPLLISSAVAGCLAGWSLIVAVGPQNAFLLRQGLKRSHIGAVIAVCALADCVLIAAGNLGIGALIAAAPWFTTALRWLGAAYLIYFAIQSFRSAARAQGLDADSAPVAKGDPGAGNAGHPGTGGEGGLGAKARTEDAGAAAPTDSGARRLDSESSESPRSTRARSTLRPVMLTTLAITFLNPGVYLDTVALLGTLSHQYPGDSWWFSVGAMFGSISWFIFLGLGARALAPLVAKPAVWRCIDVGIGLLILFLALRLLLAG
ncbi:LysE family transporter [Brevibacterium sp. 50QC2O2]|uniref:LysE/ArgO family amino acid transporter n=1 Tax=Brevibacterium TaxID=1696 RepID=UPI00211BB08B|nr:MULTISPECIES: LysE family transporter [unclassified Brevibacterium]MCQ9369136.1 LysE family transporter [Brevibacterium sp. 91QC2O2]MCQ9386493.1 LysE family transporter [Brevibacterium sp. 68QC2CO]MCQ9389951.1 LysE family transporter [Brevibacterium sp. 50QC2O2]